MLPLLPLVDKRINFVLASLAPISLSANIADINHKMHMHQLHSPVAELEQRFIALEMYVVAHVKYLYRLLLL